MMIAGTAADCPPPPLAHLVARGAAVVEGVRVARLELYGSRVVRHCMLEAAHLKKGGEAHELAAGAGKHGPPAHLVVAEGAVVDGLEVARVELQCPRVVCVWEGREWQQGRRSTSPPALRRTRNGGVKAALLPVAEAAVVVEVGVARQQRDGTREVWRWGGRVVRGPPGKACLPLAGT